MASGKAISTKTKGGGATSTSAPIGRGGKAGGLQMKPVQAPQQPRGKGRAPFGGMPMGGAGNKPTPTKPC